MASSASFSSSSSSTFSNVHSDIIRTNIFTRLDGPTLAAAASASSEWYAFSTEDKLWRDVCNSTWPSINDSRVTDVISTFPAGHRSFFSDSFPVLDHQRPAKLCLDHSLPTTSELISCADVYYKDSLIMSKTQETETMTGWFLSSPFRIDLLDLKESVLTPIVHGGEGDAWLRDLEEKLTMSWIIIDPVKRRAANISSGRAVAVERHRLTGEIQARFATVMAGEEGTGTEYVNCEAVLTCGGKEGGGMHVREASLQVEDMEARIVSGRDSLVILGEAMEKGQRKLGKGDAAKVKYEEFGERKRQRRVRKQKRDKSSDMACIVTGISIFLAVWSFMLFR